MRIDRKLTTAVFHPLQRAGVVAKGCCLPILMFHSISDDPEDGIAPYFKTNTGPTIFRQQMRQIASQGYKTVDLMQAVRLLLLGNRLPDKTLVITFDDGFRDFYTRALPALREHGFTATVFLPTAFISDQRRCFKTTECLTWSEVRDMRAQGIEFGSHTVNHPKLVDLSRAEVECELIESKTQIEQQLGEVVKTFAFPYAFPLGNTSFVSDLRSLLVQSGYDCCVTTELGRVKIGDDPFRLKRLPVNSHDDPALLLAKIEGGYDWLAWPQALIKKFKSWKAACAFSDHDRRNESCERLGDSAVSASVQ